MPMSSAVQQLLCKRISAGGRYKKNFLSSVGTPSGVWDVWGDERHIRRGGIVLLSNIGKLDGFSNFCIFFLEFSEKNRKFAIRYQLSQYFAMGKYINPFTDWGFKRLFGQEFSKDLLISFLNDLLVDEMHIRDVTFKV
jgi:hypothetical protein